MTDQEERLYLETLLLESSRWRITEDDPYSPIEREILDRLRRLNGIETIDENGYAQSDIPDNPVDEPLTTADYQALEAQKLNDYIEKKRAQNRKAKEKWKKDKVRVVLGGKMVWKPLAECVQEPRWPDKPGSTAFHWVWKGPQKEVDKLSDELWAQHEKQE